MKINCVGYSGEAKNGIIGYNCEGAASPLWFLELVTFKEIKIKLVKTFVGRVSNMEPENSGPGRVSLNKISGFSGQKTRKFQVGFRIFSGFLHRE